MWLNNNSFINYSTIILFSQKSSIIFSPFKGALSGLRQLLATEGPLKMMKNASYFTLKALFILKIFKFCPNFLVIWQNGLIRKISLVSKFVSSQPGLQTIWLHIFTNISRSKSNQELKFGQLIEYNMQNIFPENQNQNWTYLWIISLKFCTVPLYCMSSWGLSQYIETKLQTNYIYFI